MNPTAIYSKSGKGVQEASGKTSLLQRGDRAVLSAIDGRATLADVAQKVGKTFDSAFEKLIGELDRGGFIREVSPGAAAPRPAAGAKPGTKPAAPTAPMDVASDLDFTASISAPKSKPQPPPQAPPRATPAPAKQTTTIPPAPPPPSAAEKARSDQVAKQQQDTFAKAREEAERKATADRERVKAEAETKMRAETEAKLRAEAEAKARAAAEAEAEAKVKAAREAAVRAAAEAKAKAEAEAKRAREEAERIRKEAEEKIRREQEEMKRRLEEERRAREEAERKAKEEARRLEEERRKLEEERKRREEERRREEEERAARRKREEEEEQARRAERRKREEEEEAQREAERAERRKREEEDERREAAEREARRKAKSKAAEEEVALPEIEEEKPKPKPKKKDKDPEPAAAKPAGGGFADSLMADLESFTTREETEHKEKEEEERKRKEEAARRAREAEQRRQKEEAERQEREEKARRKQEEQDRKRKEEEELREREEREKARLKEEEEKRKREAEEREKKAKQDERLEAKATRGADAFSAEAELRSRRERQLGKAPSAAARAAREKRGWGKPIALTLFVLLLVAAGVAHVIPIDVAPYQTAATDAFGRPVKIGSANVSLFSGLQLKFHDVSVGEARIGEVRAFPEFEALTGARKNFSRIEIDGLKLEQQAIGDALFAAVKAENFSVAKIAIRQLELTGPLALPKGLDVELTLDGEGALRAAQVRGPEALLLRLTGKGKGAEFDLDASSFTLPFAKEISLSRFKAKGSATPQGASVDEWEGEVLGGRISGTANLRWGDTWVVDGVITARSITAAVFAPALLSEGRAEGSGKFSMRGDPGKLAESSRLDGSFTVTRGVLGSIDLSRAIQTGGKSATGRTQFSEMNGQAVYERGAVSLRNVTLTAGQLNAGASAEIAQNGALSGRIVADVRVSSQTLRATLNLGGTLKEPQVRN